VAGVPMPHDRVFDAVERLHGQLDEVRGVLTSPAASVRLVLTPESVVVAEARRTLTTLSLYGYRVDGVVANRVIPGDGGDAWRTGWAAAQSAQLAEVEESFAPLPVWRSAYRAGEPVGLPELAALGAAVYTDVDPLVLPAGEDPVRVERSGSDFLLQVALPLASKSDVDLARRGDDLVVTVGSHRRVLSLPSALRRCVVAGAAFREGVLRVRFEPDPAVWMRS